MAPWTKVSSKLSKSIHIYVTLHYYSRDSAEGFCYVNDIVIAIQNLSQIFRKVLYVDLDIHHGKKMSLKYYQR